MNSKVKITLINFDGTSIQVEVDADTYGEPIPDIVEYKDGSYIRQFTPYGNSTVVYTQGVVYKAS